MVDLYLLPASAKTSLNFSTSASARVAKVGKPAFASISEIFGPTPSTFVKSWPEVSSIILATSLATLGFSTSFTSSTISSASTTVAASF